MRIVHGVAVALAFCGIQAADAALIHNYELNGSLTDTFGGPSLVETSPSTGTVGPQAYSFAQNQGLTLTAGAFPSLSTYSIDTYFLFTDTSSYRRILDFKNLTSDSGLYNLSTALNFYPIITGPPGVFAANTPAHVTFTRDGTTKLVTGYVNGLAQLSFADSGDLGVISTMVSFFKDDNTVGGEASAGRVDFIRIYDTALTATEVAALPIGTLPTTPGTSLVPEPASWAMMIAGFGMIGAALRRRTPIAVAG